MPCWMNFEEQAQPDEIRRAREKSFHPRKPTASDIN